IGLIDTLGNNGNDDLIRDELAGVIPAIFASSLLLLPATIAGFASTTAMPSWATSIVAALGHGQPLYMVLYAALIAFFAFFYTAIVF
ncbi:hypothetical protein AB9F38_34600, partial [Rhizobium leguminosarum]